MIDYIIVIILLFIFVTLCYSKEKKICSYLQSKNNYENTVCSYQLLHHIVIYDLCSEDYPNMRCFISKLPRNIILTIHDKSSMKFKKKYCDTYENCNYIKQIKGIYPLPMINTKKSLLKLRQILLDNLKNNKDVNIVIGSGIVYKNNVNNVAQNWINTDEDTLDITNRYDITQYLIPNSVNNIIAIHVFEHISYYDIINAFINLKYLLKPEAKIFLCLPDLNARISNYWKNYTDAINKQILYGHRVFYSLKSLQFVAQNSGLKYYPLSYHMSNGDRIVNNTNYRFFENMDIKQHMIDMINCDKGYSLCAVLQK